MVTTNMFKKVFALVSVSALTGALAASGAAGCTTATSETTPAQDAGTPDATKGPAVAPSADGDAPLCYTEDPVDLTQFPYEKARVQPGKCSANVGKVVDAFANANPDFTAAELMDELVNEESQECADCVFAQDDGESWGPIVLVGNRVKAVNFGGCIEVVSGSEECGKAYQQWNMCLTQVCQNCRTNDERSECSQGAQATACKDATVALTNACGENFDSYRAACFRPGHADIAGPIVKLCGTSRTAPDAGSDGGQD